MPSAAGQTTPDSPLDTGIGTDRDSGQAQLPDDVIVALLQREHLLMLAGMHLLNLRMSAEEQQLENLNRHLKQVSIA